MKDRGFAPFVALCVDRKLYLAGNQLVGPIPSSLGDIATLSDLSLAGNELSGPIPDSFGNLTLLRYLRCAIWAVCLKINQ